jgi:hypothetical protein
LKAAGRLLLVLATLLAAAPGARAASTLLLPRMPSPQLVPEAVHDAPMSTSEIQQVIRRYLPDQTVLVRDVGAPAGEAAATDARAPRGEPQTVAASLGFHPVIDFMDEQYAPIQHAFVPVLLDWFEALASNLGYTPDSMLAAGFGSNKVARLMRVFTLVRMHRDPDQKIRVVPAIGWCRLLLQEDWGRCRAGETHTFVLVSTEKGWFVIDPFTRRMRALTRNDPRWIVEFVVL